MKALQSWAAKEYRAAVDRGEKPSDTVREVLRFQVKTPDQKQATLDRAIRNVEAGTANEFERQIVDATYGIEPEEAPSAKERVMQDIYDKAPKDAEGRIDFRNMAPEQQERFERTFLGRTWTIPTAEKTQERFDHLMFETHLLDEQGKLKNLRNVSPEALRHFGIELGRMTDRDQLRVQAALRIITAAMQAGSADAYARWKGRAGEPAEPERAGKPASPSDELVGRAQDILEELAPQAGDALEGILSPPAEPTEPTRAPTPAPSAAPSPRYESATDEQIEDALQEANGDLEETERILNRQNLTGND